MTIRAYDLATPVPTLRDLADLNIHLLAGCKEDEKRIIRDRTEAAGVLMLREREHLLPMPEHGFDLQRSAFRLSMITVAWRCERILHTGAAGHRVEVKYRL